MSSYSLASLPQNHGYAMTNKNEEDTLDMLRKRITQSKNGGNLPELARKELLQESLKKRKMNQYYI